MTPEDPTALVLAGSRTAFVAHGDCRKRLKELPDNSVDAVVTDPPAGIAFMGKAWDRMQKEGMTELQAFQEFIFEVFTEVYRVLKPGGHAVVWALPRTAHHTTMGVERAGFEIRDVVHHLFGTGFPKSLDVSKAIDKAAKGFPQGSHKSDSPNAGKFKSGTGGEDKRGQSFGAGASTWTKEAVEKYERDLVTEAADWQGWGTALKPAAENWILARKPLIGTVVANVLEHGTGALNIDATRVKGAVPSVTGQGFKTGKYGGVIGKGDTTLTGVPWSGSDAGRWPANLVLSHSPGCVTTESVWDCVPGCAIRALDEQAGEVGNGWKRNYGDQEYKGRQYGGGTFGGGAYKGGTTYVDSGGPSRFFYVAKAPGAEKSAVMTCGCTPKIKIKDIPVISMKEAKAATGQPCPVCGEKQQLHAHPTVKSISLMEWLVKLVTPPGGVVLDPFTGSGTTGVAARRLGFRFIGMEQDKVYCALARSRIK